jgi:hypothetical integral membrane protein (TIGR02206 family)
MTDLLAAGHVLPLAVIAVAAAALVVTARRGPRPWLRWMAVLLVAVEVSWWVYVVAGGVPGATIAYSLPLQLCDVGIFIAAAALWTRNPLLAEVTWFWALAGTVQALVTPDLPQQFPSYPYFQYYIAHGGVVAAALVLVVGLRMHPRPWSVVKVAGVTVVYAAFVGLVDAVTGADYMYLRSKPPSPTLLDVLGPWPWYIASATAIAIVLFAVLDAPFRRFGPWRARSQ